jgi:hypothetical protein
LDAKGVACGAGVFCYDFYTEWIFCILKTGSFQRNMQICVGDLFSTASADYY